MIEKEFVQVKILEEDRLKILALTANLKLGWFPRHHKGNREWLIHFLDHWRN